MPELDRTPMGVIFNTRGMGRYHLVIYRSGVLCVRANLIGTIQVAARYSKGGAPTTASPDPWRTWSREGRRLQQLCVSYPPQRISQLTPSYFIAVQDIVVIKIGKGPNRPRLTVETASGQHFSFAWTPVLNDWQYVSAVLRGAFGNLVKAA